MFIIKIERFIPITSILINIGLFFIIRNDNNKEVMPKYHRITTDKPKKSYPNSNHVNREKDDESGTNF